MSKLSVYLPQDRLRALARSETLPDHAHGSALFADISGFTPLTERLTQTLGARRGIEELTKRINVVYDALIRLIEQNSGSVVSFAGDSITCWFDAKSENPSRRAVATALAMQSAMRVFPDLTLKVAVTSGTARRLVVGDPQIQLLDTLAGTTIARLAVAEHLAQKGEVMADAATLEACGDVLQIKEWRDTPEANERFALIVSSLAILETVLVTTLSEDVPSETLRPWVPPTVFAREQRGLGEFLTELRPAVALFLHFDGIDYDGDESAQQKLDDWIRQVQRVVARYDGTLLQLTIGDKGSYIYACFGAPTAHEDDARRAVSASLALREIPRALTFLQPVQIGVSRGTLRVGASGSATRRIYAALGDEVNVAARLMSIAAPGEILLSGRVQQLLGERFTLEPRPPLPLKGKAEPLPVFAVTGVQRRRATRLLEPTYRLPMIGRQAELALIANKLELAHQGQGQIIGITAEAGMGKSRLVAEVIRLANRQGFVSYGGACESSGTNTPYLAWKAIWQAFFDVDPTAPVRRQLRHLEGEIQDRAPDRLQAMPLLAPLLDLQMDDNDFTRTLEPKDRRNALEALLEDCLKATVKEEPILLVLEDVHWIDPLSHDLLESLARATTNSPVCFVLAHRPPELERRQAPRVEAFPNFTKIELNELTSADAEQLIRAKLAQLFPERSSALPKALVEQLIRKAQGNPFFIEELLNYLRDRGISPYDQPALSALELPSSLHTLILSRIDQLSEKQKVTLKVASIIGRLFPFAWLNGYYPALGAPDAVKADLDELARLDITPLDTPEPELAYLFKHIVTQEVAYESLAYATRAQLHEQLAQYLETDGGTQQTAPLLDLLAFHYRRSENVTKQREYFRKAGEAAQAAYANATALDYYEHLLPLLTDSSELADLHLRWGSVLELMGRWDEAETHYRTVLAQSHRDTARTARCLMALAELYHWRGRYPAALESLAQARAAWEALNDQAGIGQALVEMGMVYHRQGKPTASLQCLKEGLVRFRKVGSEPSEAHALNILGKVLGEQGDVGAARTMLEESLGLRRQMGDKRGIADVLGDMGTVVARQGDLKTARTMLEESLGLRRQMGDKSGVAEGIGNLAVVVFSQGDIATARVMFEESLKLFRDLGDRQGIAWAIISVGYATLAQGDSAVARRMFKESLPLCHEMGDMIGVVYNFTGLAAVAVQEDASTLAARLTAAAESLRASIQQAVYPVIRLVYDQTVRAARATLGEEAFNVAFEEGKKMTLEEAIRLALDENRSHG